MVKYLDVLLILIIKCMHARKEVGVTVRDQSYHYYCGGAGAAGLMMMSRVGAFVCLL